MTEPIKQEIVSCIYENGEQLITGPVLQEVLLDMVDDSNTKDQALSSSLAEVVAEIPDVSGLATTESLNQLSESVAESIPDISGLATTESVNEATESVKEWVEAKHYLTSASLSGSVTEETVGFMIGDATASVKEWVEGKNYATEAFVSESIAGIAIPDVSGLATTESVTSLSESVAQTIADLPQADLSGYLTTASYNVDSASFDERINSARSEASDAIRETYLLNSSSIVNLSSSVANDFANLDIPDVSIYATTASVNSLSESVAQTIESLPQTDLSGYLQTSSYLVDSASFDSRIKDAREEATAAITSVSEGVVALSASFDSRINDITGSDLSGYATTESVNQLSSSVATDIQNARTEASQAITGLGTIVQGESDRVTGLSASFDDRINNITGSSVDLSGYATTASVNQLSSSVSSDILNARTEASAGFASVDQGVRALSASFDQRINDITVDLSGYLTTASFNLASESIDERLSNHQEAIEALEYAGTLYWDEDHWSASDKVDRQEFDEVSASFDQRIDAIVPPDLSTYATTASVNQVSESLSQSIAAITASGADTELRNFLFGTVTSSISSLDCSVTYLYCSQSSNATLGFSTVPEDGHSIAVDIFNVSTGSIDIFIPGTSNGYSITTNGIDYIVPYTWTIPGRQHGNLVIIRKGTDLFLRTSVDISGSGGSGTDTELRNFLFGTGTQDITSITSSIANIGATVSSDSTLGFSTVPENGESIGITIYNSSANSASIILPETVEVDNVTYNLINNGVDGSGSMAIPAGEYGDIVITREGTNLFVRTSIDISNIDVDLSGYATTASLNSVSQSLSASIAAVTGSSTDLSVLSDTTWSDNPAGQFMGNFGYVYWDDENTEWQTNLNIEALSTIGGIGLWDDMNQEWRAAASSESVYAMSASFDQRITQAIISGSGLNTETWTFILEDSSSVTKNIVVA